MLRRKNIIIVLTILLIAVGVVFFTRYQPSNTIEYVEKKITRVIGLHKEVVVSSMIHDGNHRLVSYLVLDSGTYNKMDMAHFTVNEEGNYCFEKLIKPDKIIEYKTGISVSEYYKPVVDGYEMGHHYFIVSNNKDLSSIERVLECGEMEIIVVNEVPYVTQFIDLDDKKTSEINFYNSDGEEIE